MSWTAAQQVRTNLPLPDAEVEAGKWQLLAHHPRCEETQGAYLVTRCRRIREKLTCVP